MIDVQRRLADESSTSHGGSTTANLKSTFTPISLTAHSSKTETRGGDRFLSTDDRKLIRSVVKSFDASVNHLRAVIQAAERCLDLQRGCKDASTTRVASMSSLLVVLDLGQDPRFTPITDGSSCFHEKGLYFVVEAYLFPSEQYLQQLQKVNSPSGGLPEQGLMTRCRRRRHVGCGGIIGEGGHFDHLINTHRAFYESTGLHPAVPNHSSQSRRSVVACGLRLNLDRVVDFMTKYEMRQSKISNMRKSKSNNVMNQLAKYSFVDRFRNDVSVILDNSWDTLDVLLSDVDQSVDPTTDLKSRGSPLLLSAPGQSTTCSPSPAVLSVLSLLRSCGIRATCLLNQLSCNIAVTDRVTAEEACFRMKIPLLCIVLSETSVALKVGSI